MVENVIQIKSEITINADASVKIQENIVYAKKNYSWNPTTSTWKELGLMSFHHLQLPDKIFCCFERNHNQNVSYENYRLPENQKF